MKASQPVALSRHQALHCHQVQALCARSKDSDPGKMNSVYGKDLSATSGLRLHALEAYK